MASTGIPRTTALIPGAYERDALTYRQSGAMGGPAFGSANVQTGCPSMSAATTADREIEGGGAASQRRRTAAGKLAAPGPSRTYAIWNSVRSTSEIRVAFKPLRRTKSAIGAAWILAAGVIGVTANVTSVGGAVLLAGFGLVPPLVMLLLLRWSDSQQTLSESIQEARG